MYNKKATVSSVAILFQSELLLGGLNGLCGLFAATAAALVIALALILLLGEEFVLQHLGEQEVSADNSSSYTDHDTKNDESNVLFLLFLMEAQHSKYPPCLAEISFP